MLIMISCKIFVTFHCVFESTVFVVQYFYGIFNKFEIVWKILRGRVFKFPECNRLKIIVKILAWMSVRCNVRDLLLYEPAIIFINTLSVDISCRQH